MNITSLILFLLGSVAAGCLAVGMDPQSCGLPLILLAVAVIFGSWHQAALPRARWVYTWIAITVVYLLVRMWQTDLVDFARSDALLLAGVALAFWWTVCCGGKNKFTWWLGGMWILAFVNVSIAAVQAYHDINFFPVLVIRATDHFPSGLYLHYNHFSNFLLGIGMLSLGYGMVGNMKRIMRLACFVMYVVCVFGLYLGSSRGAWLGLGCGTALVMVGWLANLWRTKTSWAGAALIAATVISPLLITGAWKLGSHVVAHRQTGDSGRLEFASIAVDLIQERPLWGGGSRAFFFDSFAKWNPKELWIGSGDIQYVHNEYLQAAVDYGLVGLALILGVFAIVMFRGVALLTVGSREFRGEAGIALGAMAALCAMGVQAFFQFVYHVLPDVILMGCCIGWLVKQPWALSKPQLAEPVGRFGLLLRGLCGTGIAVMIVILAARDAAAWWALYPKLDYTKVDDQEYERRYRKAVHLRPDFRLMSDYAIVLADLARNENSKVEERAAYLQLAIDWQEATVKRAPVSYKDIVNLALLYDSVGRLDEAEVLYQKVLPDLDAREMYYGTRYFYARHLALRANAVWRQREPEKALLLFLRAKDELSRLPAIYKNTDPQVRRSIEQSIVFLKSANIQPASSEE